MKKFVVLFMCIFLTGCMEREYTVTFDTEGGTNINSITVLKGEKVNVPEEPTRDGYIFVDWLLDGKKYDFNKPVKANIKLTASWVLVPITERYYNVIYNDGTTETKIKVKYKDKANKPDDPYMQYHKFLGWYVGDKEYDFDSLIVRDVYIVAKFQRIRIPITFKLNGGAGISNKEVEAGTVLKEPKKPEKYGYEFLGWYDGDTKYDFKKIVTKELTLSAKWKLINYIEVKFNTGGGTKIDSQILNEGDVIKEPSIPERDGYVFDYWAYNGEKYDFNTKIFENITLDAVYKNIIE